jgi:hypothetical protein
MTATSRRSGSTGERYGYIDGHQGTPRPLSRFLIFALAVIVSIGALTAGSSTSRS